MGNNLPKPIARSVLYETHLKGFTADPSSGVKNPGTYKGLIEKIPYLKELGVTSVEFLPIQEFDEYENTNVNPRTGEKIQIKASKNVRFKSGAKLKESL